MAQAVLRGPRESRKTSRDRRATRSLSPRGERGPTLGTLHAIEMILRKAEAPLSLNEVRRRMEARAVRHATVRAAVDEFVRLGHAREGTAGIRWVSRGLPEPSSRPRRHASASVPDIDELAGSLAKYGPVEDVIRELDAMRAEDE